MLLQVVTKLIAVSLGGGRVYPSYLAQILFVFALVYWMVASVLYLFPEGFLGVGCIYRLYNYNIIFITCNDTKLHTGELDYQIR